MTVSISVRGLVELLDVVTGERIWGFVSALRSCEVVTAARGLEVVVSVFILKKGMTLLAVVERMGELTAARGLEVVVVVSVFILKRGMTLLGVVERMGEVTAARGLEVVVYFLLMGLVGMTYFLMQLVVETMGAGVVVEVVEAAVEEVEVV